MSNFLSKFRKENKKDYKTLYETELNNRKLIELRYKELKKENIELQKGTGLAELRVKFNKALDEIENNDEKYSADSRIMRSYIKKLKQEKSI